MRALGKLPPPPTYIFSLTKLQGSLNKKLITAVSLDIKIVLSADILTVGDIVLNRMGNTALVLGLLLASVNTPEGTIILILLLLLSNGVSVKLYNLLVVVTKDPIVPLITVISAKAKLVLGSVRLKEILAVEPFNNLGIVSEFARVIVNEGLTADTGIDSTSL